MIAEIVVKVGQLWYELLFHYYNNEWLLDSFI